MSRILDVLTGFVYDCQEIMEQNVRTMEKLDFIFSKRKAELPVRRDGAVHQSGKKNCPEGRTPPADGENVSVPLQFSMGEGVNGIVITGPNTGGKTVAIKTVALNA